MSITPAQQAHYTNTGWLLLNHALSEVGPILTRLGHPELASVPSAGIALPMGNGAAPATVALPAGQVLSGLEGLAARIGTIKSRGGEKKFRFAVTALPTHDGFGRPFPTLEALMGQAPTNIRKHFTNSGWPKVVVAGMTFYQQKEEGESTFKAPIKAGDWRMWNGVPGPAAEYVRCDEILRYLTERKGMDVAKATELLTKEGLSIGQPSTTPTPEAASKGKGKGKAAKPTAEAKA